ncbi:MAG: M23 family metallopeptidase [Burkholderiaceae bacterium]
MPVSSVKIGLSSLAAMGVAVTAFGVSSPNEQGSVINQLVVDRLVIPTVEGSHFTAADHSFIVREGDTLDKILLRGGAIDAEFIEFVSRDEDARRLLELVPSEQLHARIDSIGRVQEVRLSLGEDEVDLDRRQGKRLIVTRGRAGLRAEVQTIDLIRNSRMGYGRIVSTLFATTEGANIPERVASQIVDVLGGELNFQHDLRQGDELRVLYETLTEPDRLDTEYAGKLLAVEYKGKERTLNAMWLENEDGSGQYYDFDGRSSRSFLRYPIEYARISSGFTRGRWHPILARRVPHRGVDFVAVPGTKIRASGHGRIEFIGEQRGYGRTVIIRHSDGITTLYAHMRAFAKKLKRGQSVRQGDVIGYVGSSGWATGPHLHYEYRVSGEHRNPLTVSLPEASPLEPEMRRLQIERATQLRAQLEQVETIQLAGRFE